MDCYSSEMETGIIIAAGGKRYVFSKAEWLSAVNKPNAGLLVTFDPAESYARRIMIAGK